MLKTSWIVLLLISFSRADIVSLCGDPDTEIDLTNSLTLQLSGDTTFFSGSIFVLTVPDLRSVDAWEVSGTVRVPYRFRVSGEVLDDNGGIWGTPQVVASDQRGVTALAFVLENGNLPPGTRVTLKDITVFQCVSDGPGQVIVTVDFWGTLNKGKTLWAEKFRLTTSQYISCSEGTNSAPVPINKSVRLMDGEGVFRLEGVDPESSTSQLNFHVIQDPRYGELEHTESVYRYQADSSFPGFDELVFSVDDGVSVRQGRICFYASAVENWITFASHIGLTFQGLGHGDFRPEVMSYSSQPAHIQFLLDGQTISPAVSIDAMSEGTHLLSVELRADADQQVLATDFIYLYRTAESGEIFLDHRGPGQESGFIRSGRYCELDLRSFDPHDEFVLDLRTEVQPLEATLSGINESTLKASMWGEQNDLWSVVEDATNSWTKSFLPGDVYFLQLDDLQEASATYTLDLFPKFSHYAIPVLSAGDTVTVINSHAVPVIVDMFDDGGVSHKVLLQPGQGLDQLIGNKRSGAHFLQSSMSLDVVLVQADEGVLSASAFPFGASRSGLLPHLAAQTDFWENQFFYACSNAHDLDWEYANGLGESITLEAAGASVFDFPGMPSMPNQSWAKYGTDEMVLLDGYARFRRKASNSDHSMVTGTRNDFFGRSLISRSLYLPHVAADRELFWTGYSVLNPHPTRNATLVIRGMSDEGEELTRESTTLSAGTQEVSVIGIDRFAQQEGISWIRIDSSLPIQGIEMFGGNGGEGYLAGFLLPSQPKERLIFPYAESDDLVWSGVAVINASGAVQEVNVSYIFEDGTPFDTTLMSLNPNTKTTFLVPTGFCGTVRCDSTAQARCLLGFILVGDRNRTALAGYIGM